MRGAGPPAAVTVRHARREDAAAWLALRAAFWHEESEAEHGRSIKRFLAGELPALAAAFLAVDAAGRAVGMAELSLRPYAEGCRSERVAFLEGWFVVPEARGRGVGRALVAAAEAWGRNQGCRELASDTPAGNTGSIAAHRALGFDDAGTVRCFRKDLMPAPAEDPGWAGAPVFGAGRDGGAAVVRPSAYVIVEDAEGRIALTRTPQGVYLPGGGLEAGESPAQAAAREALEECGLVVRVGPWSARAVQLARSAAEGVWFEKRSTIFEAVLEALVPATAPGGHELLWASGEEAAGLLAHESHAWALAHRPRR